MLSEAHTSWSLNLIPFLVPLQFFFSTQLEKPVDQKKNYTVLLSYVYTLHFAINGGNVLSFAVDKYGKVVDCL